MGEALKTIGALCGTLSLGACASISANSDYYAEADFSGYESYAWISDMPFIVPAGYDIAVSPLNQRRIKESVESELAVKGFALAGEPDNADFVISVTVGTREGIDANAYPLRYRGSWGWRNSLFYYGTQVDAQTYTEGVLAIDIFDEETNQPVWHGWAQKRITDSDLVNAAEQIQAAVRAIFADFPPPGTKNRR